jgi:hypothetical protein
MKRGIIIQSDISPVCELVGDNLSPGLLYKTFKLNSSCDPNVCCCFGSEIVIRDRVEDDFGYVFGTPHGNCTTFDRSHKLKKTSENSYLLAGFTTYTSFRNYTVVIKSPKCSIYYLSTQKGSHEYLVAVTLLGACLLCLLIRWLQKWQMKRDKEQELLAKERGLQPAQPAQVVIPEQRQPTFMENLCAAFVTILAGIFK